MKTILTPKHTTTKLLHAFQQQLVILLALLLVPITACLSSESITEFTVSHTLSSVIIELATNEEYDNAFHLIDSLITQYPANPYGYLLSATVLSGRAIDFEDNLDDQAILNACNIVRDQTLEMNPDTSAYLLYYLGMADMYCGLVLKRQGKLYSHLRRTLRAGHYLEKANTLDPTFWDAYYGLGMYRYYRSKSAGILRSLGIISDQREEGLNNIQTAVDRGTLTPVAARNSLAWIDLENKDYDSAVKRSRQSLEQYPNRRAFLWCLGKALSYSKRWKEAIPVFSSILESVRLYERNNHYNELTCLYFLTSAYHATGDYNMVLELSDTALKLKLDPVVRSRKKKDIEALNRMRDESLMQSDRDN